LIGCTKGEVNTKLLAIPGAKGRPLKLFMTAGQVGDHTRAAALLGGLPAADWMIAESGCRAGMRRQFKRTEKGHLVPRCV
jgi:hypothetical protein